MVPYHLFGFRAEFFRKLPDIGELDEYFRLEFSKRHPGWQPRFGKVAWFDPDSKRWEYMFLLTGKVPQAKSQTDATHKVHRLTHQLATGFLAAHLNPGIPLPDPVIHVWEESASDAVPMAG